MCTSRAFSCSRPISRRELDPDGKRSAARWQPSFIHHHMASRKDVAVSFLRHAASGRVREGYGNHVSTDIGQPVPAESVNTNGLF
jgi:hypothetical protein